MHDWSQDIGAVRGIKAIPTILDIVCRTTGMRFAAVARVTENHWIACSVRDDIAFGLLPGGELDLESTLCHEVRQSGQAIVIDHVAQDPTYRAHHTPAIYGIQSYLSIPIRLDNGTFFGTLCAIDPEPHRVSTPETLAMLEMFADIIGLHLSAVDRVRASEATLAGERAASALREQFVAVLGHDLRNPLAAIDGGMQLLRRTPLNEKATAIVDMVQGSVTRMAGLIDDVMDLTRGRLGDGLDLERDADGDLAAVLSQVVAELQAGSPDRAIVSCLEITQPVHCDRRRLGQLASNLLANALTHGDAGQPIRIEAVTARGRLELRVVNGGPPIPPAVMENLFRPFSRGAVRPGLQGLGLGLYIAHEIAKAHGGTLEASSTEAETRFTFRMPLRP